MSVNGSGADESEVVCYRVVKIIYKKKNVDEGNEQNKANKLLKKRTQTIDEADNRKPNKQKSRLLGESGRHFEVVSVPQWRLGDTVAAFWERIKKKKKKSKEKSSYGTRLYAMRAAMALSVCIDR